MLHDTQVLSIMTSMTEYIPVRSKPTYMLISNPSTFFVVFRFFDPPELDQCR